VHMWKPSSVVKAVENARYAEEQMNLTGGTRSTFPHRSGFVGKTSRTFYGNRVRTRDSSCRDFNGS
jgi:hypothetical protein